MLYGIKVSISGTGAYSSDSIVSNIHIDDCNVGISTGGIIHMAAAASNQFIFENITISGIQCGTATLTDCTAIGLYALAAVDVRGFIFTNSTIGTAVSIQITTAVAQVCVYVFMYVYVYMYLYPC